MSGWTTYSIAPIWVIHSFYSHCLKSIAALKSLVFLNICSSLEIYSVFLWSLDHWAFLASLALGQHMGLSSFLLSPLRRHLSPYIYYGYYLHCALHVSQLILIVSMAVCCLIHICYYSLFYMSCCSYCAVAEPLWSAIDRTKSLLIVVDLLALIAS